MGGKNYGQEKENQIEEILKNMDSETLTDILTDSVKQAVKNITTLTPEALEADIKQISLLLNRQGNGEELLKQASDLKNNGNILNELAEMLATNKIDLFAADDIDGKPKQK